MVELVYTTDLKSVARKGLRVQIPLLAPKIINNAMHYYLYQIRNKVNDKIYIGVHSTNNMDDGYMGSGAAISDAVSKYGISNFEKTILELFDDSKSMYDREREIVNEQFISRPDVYNMKTGGHGGFDHINKNKDETYLKIRSENGKNFNFKTTNNEKFKPRYGKDNYAYGIKTKTNFAVSEEIRKKAQVSALSETANAKRKETMLKKEHQAGQKNSQFGTMWVTNNTQNKKIKKDAVIPDGWVKGRIKGNTK